MDSLVEMVGTPFAWGARGPDAYDCYGFVMKCHAVNGITLPDFGFATSQAQISAMMGVTLPQWEEIPRRKGAVVLIRVGRYVSHVGYMLDDDRMIHTWDKSGGVVIERVDVWKQQITGFYKYVGN